MAEDDAGLIEKLRLTESRYLKRAAVLLFHPDPERFFTGAAVKIGYFASESNLRYHDEIRGDLLTQVDRTMELLLSKYLKAAISYEGIQRVESYPVPERALRETVLNAVVHRDYAIAAPIQIRVHADRLRVWNPGELPENWSLTKLIGQHPSRPFNPDVANAFFRAGEIEAWGRGIQRVFEACHQAGAPKPRIHVEPGELSVEFPFSAAYLDSLSGATTEEAPRKTSGKTSGKIVAMIRENPTVTIPEMAEALGMSTRAVELQIAKLRDSATVERIGPAKGGHWKVVGGADE